MRKIFQRFSSQKLKAKGETGQVQGRGRFDKFFGLARRNWGLAARLEHISNRGRQNK